MALHVPKAPGVSQMLKEGARVSCSKFSKPTFVHTWCWFGLWL